MNNIHEKIGKRKQFSSTIVIFLYFLKVYVSQLVLNISENIKVQVFCSVNITHQGVKKKKPVFFLH